jgi:hypothetical protein
MPTAPVCGGMSFGRPMLLSADRCIELVVSNFEQL